MVLLVPNSLKDRELAENELEKNFPESNWQNSGFHLTGRDSRFTTRF